MIGISFDATRLAVRRNVPSPPETETEVGFEIVVFKHIVGVNRHTGLPDQSFVEATVYADKDVEGCETVEKSCDMPDVVRSLTALAEDGYFHKIKVGRLIGKYF